MEVTREEQKREAIERMKAFGVIRDAIRQFEKDDIVMLSEPHSFDGNPDHAYGALYWLEDEDKALVKEFEEKNGALVYMVVRSFTTIGVMDSYMYVSKYKEEWEMDREDIKNGIQLVYVRNHDMPDCSEFGSIYVRQSGGGLVRKFQ